MRPRRTGRGAGSKEEAPVQARASHADRVVEANGGLVLAAHEQAYRRRPFEEPTAEVAKPALRIAVAPGLGIDPHLLELDSSRRPCRRLGLEEDRAALFP